MIALRPIVPQDGEAFQSFVDGLSPGSRINRFLHPVKVLAPASLHALVQADQARHVALVATEGTEIVGEVRYVVLGDSGFGEFAIAVAERWQRQGLGARMLGALVAVARRAGLAALQGEVLRTNDAMLQLARRSGFQLGICPGDASLALVEKVLD